MDIRKEVFCVVIRFDRPDLPGKESRSHYNGFVLPNDGMLSELMALLPERCDLLTERGTLWRVRCARGKREALFYLAVDDEGSYAFGLLSPDRPASFIEKGEITAENLYCGSFLIGSPEYKDLLKTI